MEVLASKLQGSLNSLLKTQMLNEDKERRNQCITSARLQLRTLRVVQSLKRLSKGLASSYTDSDARLLAVKEVHSKEIVVLQKEMQAVENVGNSYADLLRLAARLAMHLCGEDQSWKSLKPVNHIAISLLVGAWPPLIPIPGQI